jgi:peptide/nickel transport system ATP-binding protein
LLEVSGLEKHFDQSGGLIDRLFGDAEVVHAVDGVDLTIHDGETVAVVGESGCGKSTLGRAILNLDRPTAGSVKYRGTELVGLSDGEMRPYRRDLQMIFQDPLGPLNPRHTIGEILRAPLEVHDIGDGKSNRRARIEAMLERIGLKTSHIDRYPRQFSGGQQQRVGIARALMLEPELLIADEPVSALDVSVQAQILGLLEELKAEMGLSMLFITHDLSVVRYIADRVSVMYLGEIVETAPVDELFRDPKHPYTKALLSSVPRIEPEAREERIVLGGSVPSPVDPPAGCRFHTRCRDVIPPDDWTGTQAAFRDAFRFRTHVVEEGIDVESIERRLDSEVGDPQRAAVAEHILETVYDGDVSNLPDERAAALREAATSLATGADREAQRRLAEAFPSPCVDSVPNTVSPTASRTVACHRVESESHSNQSPTNSELI